MSSEHETRMDPEKPQTDGHQYLAASCSRRTFLKSSGALIVGFSWSGLVKAQGTGTEPTALADIPIDQVDSYLAIANDGSVTVFTGRIDMGTGNRTCFVQMVADELDVALDRISIVCGDTDLTPDGGKTTASDAVPTGGQPLRVTAATARQKLLELGSEHLAVRIDQLAVSDGIVGVESDPSKRVSYGELIGDQRFDIQLEVDRLTLSGPLLKVPDGVSLKTVDQYQHVRRSVPRIDMPDRIIAGTFSQNVRVAGMLHGRCIRPASIGSTLLSVDESSVRNLPGFVQLVADGNFVGVVCEREEQAIQAQEALELTWSQGTGLPDDAYRTIRTAAPETRAADPTQTRSQGDVNAALMNAAEVLTATYEYPWNSHTMLGPTCAVADVREDGTTIWSGTQWPRMTQRDIAFLLDLPIERVRVIWVEESGSYGRLAAADAAADAALLSQAVGRPVRVQWTRLEEHAWAPHQPPLVIDVRAGLSAEGRIVAWDLESWTSTPHDVGRGGGLLAMRLVGRDPGPSTPPTLGARALDPPYPVPNLRSVNHTVEPLFRACYMRSPGGIQGTFVNESFIDELAAAAVVDPIEFRLQHMTSESDERSIAALQAAARAVDWDSRPSPKPASNAAIVTGRGVALARSEICVTVAEVEVDRDTGAVRVIRLTAAFDCGLIVNPDGLTNQLEQATLQGMSRALLEEVTFDDSKIISVDWITHPIMRFSEVPIVQVVLLDRPDEVPLGAGEPATTQVPAAIGNAIFDATGVRIRRAPFTPERVKAALAEA